jgi:hypothetical protein
MKSILTFALLLFSLISMAEEATYFRAWQGFKNPKLTHGAFLQELPKFMKETVDLYRDRALVNYLVIIPPKNKPAFIPDEFALVALTSKDDYQSIRQTTEGQRYSERHWDLFNKENSKSADPMIDFTAELPSTLVHNNSYDMIGTPIDWSRGYNRVYIGVRKSSVSNIEFLRKLSTHASMFKRTMIPKGVRGYILIANNDYEVAYVNWESEKSHDNAYKTAGGIAVAKDGSEILDNLLYQEAKPYITNLRKDVIEGEAYSTLPASYPYEGTYDGDGH